METIVKFLMGYGIFCLIILGFAVYFTVRSFKVIKFRSKFFDIVNNIHGTEIHYSNKEVVRNIEKKVCGSSSFSKMTFSFKPLKLKYWFNPKEAKLLESQTKGPKKIKTRPENLPTCKIKEGLGIIYSQFFYT